MDTEDTLRYVNGHLEIIGNNGLRKTSLDLKNDSIEFALKRFYTSGYKKDHYYGALKWPASRYDYSLRTSGDDVVIYYNRKSCKVNKKELMFELDKHFKKEVEINYCTIC